MFEMIKHFLGLCPDHSSHLNVMDSLGLGGALLLPLQLTWAWISKNRRVLFGAIAIGLCVLAIALQSPVVRYYLATNF